jgi:hypothetical protein
LHVRRTYVCYEWILYTVPISAFVVILISVKLQTKDDTITGMKKELVQKESELESQRETGKQGLQVLVLLFHLCVS